MTSWMGTENSVQLIAHTKWGYEHIKALPNLKVISYKSPGRQAGTDTPTIYFIVLHCKTDFDGLNNTHTSVQHTIFPI